MNILNINEDSFIDQVIEKSKNTPVLVDFWAPWCGPCKQLTPLLEELIEKKNGKIILAKINIEENQNIAAQLNIQSIPTVYGFVDGKPIDAFQGLQPKSKIESMIDKMIDSMPGNEIPQIIEQAENLFKSQKFEEAQIVYEKLITMESDNPKIITGLIRCLIQLNKLIDARNILDSLEEKILENSEIQNISKLLQGLNNPSSNNEIENLKNKLIDDPLNKKIRFELAEIYLSSNDVKSGFDELLEIFNQDSKWNNSAAKNKLLEQFGLLGFNDPNVVEARKRLSSLMFK